MDSIAIDSSGEISVRSLIKHLMPQLHDSSVLRGAHRALKAAGVSEMSTTLINGRLTKTATLDACLGMLDKMPGQKWREWRETSGPAFKQALRERVERIISTAQVEEVGEEEQPMNEEQVEEVETKAVALRRALRAVNIDGSVRVDEPTGLASNIDVVRMLCPDTSCEYAAQMLRRVLEKDSIEGGNSSMQTSSNSSPLADRVHYIKINGKGRFTPCSDAPTIIEIIWLLPARATREFRKQSAETIARVLGGDVSLCSEIEQRCTRLQSTEEGRAYQSLMLGEAPAKKHKGLPDWFEYASDEQKRTYISAEIENHVSVTMAENNKRVAETKKIVAETEIEIHEVCRDKLRACGQLGGRDEIEYADRIRDTQQRVSRADGLLGAPDASTSIGDQALVVAREIDNSIDPDTGMIIATHKVSASVRGPETSICAEAAKLGISTGEKAGQIGKVAKRMYGDRYGDEANRRIPIRHTTFRGKPFQERTYYQRDADILQRAIRAVFPESGGSSSS